MNIDISIKNSKGSNLHMMNNMEMGTQSENIKLDIDNIEFSNDISILNGTKFSQLEQDILTKMLSMNPNTAEYHALKQIFKNRDKNQRKQLLQQHIQSFAEGVVASIVASYIMQL